MQHKPRSSTGTQQYAHTQWQAVDQIVSTAVLHHNGFQIEHALGS